MKEWTQSATSLKITLHYVLRFFCDGLDLKVFVVTNWIKDVHWT